MPRLFRTLGPVGVPVNPEDPVNKGYVDNISPDSLTYLRLSETQVTAAGSPATYAAGADVNLGQVYTGNINPYSRAPFRLQIIRYGLSYQHTSLNNFNAAFTAPYVMSLFIWQDVAPFFTLVDSATLAAGQKNLDSGAKALNIGTSANSVFSWSFGTTGTSTNVGSIYLSAWFEFKPLGEAQYLEQLEDQQKRIKEYNAENKDKEWYKELMENKAKSIDERINKKENNPK